LLFHIIFQAAIDQFVIQIQRFGQEVAYVTYLPAQSGTVN